MWILITRYGIEVVGLVTPPQHAVAEMESGHEDAAPPPTPGGEGEEGGEDTTGVEVPAPAPKNWRRKLMGQHDSMLLQKY